MVSQTRLKDFSQKHPASTGPLKKWYAATSHARWNCFDDIRNTFNSADLVGGLVVFNVNSYRVVVDVLYGINRAYIKHVFTHAEYER